MYRAAKVSSETLQTKRGGIYSNYCAAPNCTNGFYKKRSSGKSCSDFQLRKQGSKKIFSDFLAQILWGAQLQLSLMAHWLSYLYRSIDLQTLNFRVPVSKIIEVIKAPKCLLSCACDVYLSVCFIRTACAMAIANKPLFDTKKEVKVSLLSTVSVTEY